MVLDPFCGCVAACLAGNSAGRRCNGSRRKFPFHPLELDHVVPAVAVFRTTTSICNCCALTATGSAATHSTRRASYPPKGERLHLGTRSGSYKRLRGKGALKKVDNGDSVCVQLYSAAGEGFGMPDVHFHIWIYQRDSDGVIRSMERRAEQFDTRRKANYALEMFRRQRSLAGQVLQCVDGTFCKPPPDWVVTQFEMGYQRIG